MNLKKSNKSQEGFSLIELVVVTAVLATLSAIAIPRFMGIINNARLQRIKEAELSSDLDGLTSKCRKKAGYK